MPSPTREPDPPRGGQPLAVSLHPGALLTLPTVSAVTGLSARTVRRLAGEGRFPSGVRVPGTACVRWPSASVNAWLKATAEAQAAA